MREYQPNEDLIWREVYGQEYRAAEDRGLESWQAREVAAKAAWADYEERTGQPALLRNAGHQPNGTSYYVWALARGSDTPLDEGPWGPYDNLDSAKTFARISATEGKHDRAVSCGLNPQSPSFEIVRRYEAGTGERLL